ncbi:MAG: DUF1934 domain-containing protein [Clostridia bacterium]|nr:DUF1934 domain-containing protein [Clostridia bacterium]
MAMDEKNLQPQSIPVLISVTGKNRAMDNGDEMDAVKLMTMGRLSPVGDGWRLDYEETDPDGGAKQKIRMDMQDKRVTMQRVGEYGTTMVFEKDHRFEGYYHTPFGNLRMGVFATRVYWKVDKGQGQVELQYQLDMQGNFSAVHDLTLRFAQNG